MNTAKITVKLFGPLRGRENADQTLAISENDTIQSAVARLAIEPHPSYLYSVNGKHARADTRLCDGDMLIILPPISGG